MWLDGMLLLGTSGKAHTLAAAPDTTAAAPAPCTKRGGERGVSMPSAAPLGTQLRATADAEVGGACWGAQARRAMWLQSSRSRTRQPWLGLRSRQKVMRYCLRSLGTRSALLGAVRVEVPQ
jgi:hypothetical protein